MSNITCRLYVHLLPLVLGHTHNFNLVKRITGRIVFELTRLPYYTL